MAKFKEGDRVYLNTNTVCGVFMKGEYGTVVEVTREEMYNSRVVRVCFDSYPDDRHMTALESELEIDPISLTPLYQALR